MIEETALCLSHAVMYEQEIHVVDSRSVSAVPY